MTWYKLTTRRIDDSKLLQIIYLWAGGIDEVLYRYNKLCGIPENGSPRIRNLSTRESKVLEESIVEDRNWSVKGAKKQGVRYHKEERPPV